MMREVLIISHQGAAGEGGRELRRGFCAPGLPLATHNIHRAAEFVGSIRALPSPISLACTLVHLRQKPTSSLLESLSLSVAPAFHEQERSSGEVAWGAKKLSNRSTKL